MKNIIVNVSLYKMYHSNFEIKTMIIENILLKTKINTDW